MRSLCDVGLVKPGYPAKIQAFERGTPTEREADLRTVLRLCGAPQSSCSSTQVGT